MSGLVAAAVVATTTALSIGFQVSAQSDTKKANRKAKRIETIKMQRERAQALAANQVTRAQVEAASTNTGGQGSSGVAGAVGSLATQAAVGANITDTINNLNNSRINAQAKADEKLAYASYAQQIGQAVSTYGQYKYYASRSQAPATVET